MGSSGRWSGVSRCVVAAAGLLGLFLAVDALFLFVLILASPLFGGDIHPYAGLFLFVIVPVVVVVGAGAAWAAYRIWRTIPADRPAPAEDAVLRT